MDNFLENPIQYIAYVLLGIAIIILLFRSFFTVQQGEVAVLTRFGKFKGICLPGLSFKNPILDSVFVTISIQNQTQELKFQAITSDQANVHFQAMLLYAVKDNSSDIIHKVAYKFNSDEEFESALVRTIEGTIRSFVGTKKQGEILTLRKEIIEYVKAHLDNTLEDWGYHLLDVQINDITFDQEIMQSMARVVSSSNLRAAAENEGAALLIQKTKAAEAEGKYIIIQAESEKQAAKLRGEGVAEFRQAVAAGLKESATELQGTGLGGEVIMFSMWTEAIKNFAEAGQGNVIFLDGSTDGMNRVLASMNKPPLGAQWAGGPVAKATAQ